jgi:peptidoglycan/xylan/chitin deacetylase (PgdA/CDA1 family)
MLSTKPDRLRPTADRLRQAVLPAFLVVIDTEGDNQWARSRVVTTENSRYLRRFQELCERHQLRPTYLTNWEMVNCSVFQEFGRDVLARGTAEIGMHLHAWHSPPFVPLTKDDYQHQPYLSEYPVEQMRAKVQVLTQTLEDTFGRKMVSHRAGRWGFDSRYARILSEAGYLVDCSVTPHLSWRGHPGAPNGTGGPDFTHFPTQAYFLDLDDISKPGNSSLLEAPMTVARSEQPLARRLHRLVRNAPRLLRAPINRLFPPTCRLEPNGRNLRHLLRILRQAKEQGKDYVQFTLHSSEIMPGGSSKFPSKESIETLYRHMEKLFMVAQDTFAGLTLHEYYERYLARQLTNGEY